MLRQLELCKRIALNAHYGQTRRDGSPYINHPERVAEMFPENPRLACIAWLHDVLEDTTETKESLTEKGVYLEIVYAVDLLTRKTDQSYDTYINSLSQRRFANRVKIADMIDNLCDNPSNGQKVKYRKAISILMLHN